MIDFNSFSTDKLCRWFICHSYLYYEYDQSIISDHEFDALAKILLDRWDELEYNKEMKEYWIDQIGITKDDLIAGSGHSLDFKNLPLRMQMIVQTLKSGYDIKGEPINLEEWLK